MTLAELRGRIDRIDARVVGFLNARARVAIAIGEVKADRHEDTFVAAREKEVLARIRKRNRGPLSDASLEAIYREIISGSRACEKKIRIAFHGQAFTKSHLAAMSRFGNSTVYAPSATVEEVFEAVERRRADHGVVPLEICESDAGATTVLRFARTRLKVCAEIWLGGDRVLVLGRKYGESSGEDKTSLLFSGVWAGEALYRVLRPMRALGVSAITVLTVTDRRKSGVSYYWLDIEGHEKDRRVAKALAAVAQGDGAVKVLGSYPRAR